MREFGTTTQHGLSEDEAACEARAEGYNEHPSTRRRSLLAIAWEIAREPMILLLVGAGRSTCSSGTREKPSSCSGLVCVVVGIKLYQERRTEHALEALRDLSSPRALVIRDGEQRRIPGREVVRDDLLVLAEGDRVPADAVLLWCTHLAADESLLTGESVPVRKIRWDAGRAETRAARRRRPALRVLGNARHQGQGVARVVATGADSEMGRIGTALQTLGPSARACSTKPTRVVDGWLGVGLALCAVVIVATGLPAAAWSTGCWPASPLAMSLIPEEFPVVLTVFLALGAWRIAPATSSPAASRPSRRWARPRCCASDKTGTLTQNRMSVARLVVRRRVLRCRRRAAAPSAEPSTALVEFGMLASQVDPFDPMERAIKRAAVSSDARRGPSTFTPTGRWSRSTRSRRTCWR